MDFGAPQWLWTALAGPLAGAGALLLWRRRIRASAAWAARGLWDRLLPGYRPRRLWMPPILLAAVVSASAVSLARPRWGMSEQQVERQGIDIVFILDTSLSMAARDVQPSRLWVAQAIIRRLVQALPGHRVALVQGEGDGVVMAPLTVDQAVVDLLLDAVQPGSLPTPGTELAPVLDRALGLYPKGSDKHRVIVLVSDGEDHGGRMEATLERLEEAGVVVHTVGVGTPEGQPLELPPQHAVDGGRYKTDEEGHVVVSRLVETTLEALARATGGVYVRATNAAASLDKLVERIEGMEARTLGSEWISVLEERFQWPLLASLAALGLLLFASPFAAAGRMRS